MTDDPELLRQYLDQSSEAAFAELVRRHVDFVYGVALRHARNPHRAEDVTQMVFAALARKGDALSRRTELVGWLYNSTRFAAAKIIRTEVRREAREQEAQMDPPADDSAAIEWQLLQPILDQALAGLGQIDRSALLLRFFRNCSFSEVGARLAVSEEAARKRVDRALEKLRGRLAQRGITSTAAVLTAAMGSQVATAAPATLARSVLLSAQAVQSGAAGSLLLDLARALTTSKAALTAAVVVGSLSIGAVAYEFAQQRQAETALGDQRGAYNQFLSDRRTSSNALRAAQTKPGVHAPVAGARDTAVSQRPLKGEGIGGPLTDSSILGLARLSAKGSYRRRYGPYFVEQNWSPAQIEAFLEAKIGPLFAHPENGVVDFGAHEAEVTAAEQALLGEMGLQQLQDFERTLPFQALLRQLAGAVYAIDPLSSQQAHGLIRVWTQNQIRYHNPPEPDDWPSLLGRAQGILTTTQLAVLQQIGATVTDLDASSSSALFVAP